MKHKNTRTRKNWKPKQKQERNIPKPSGREIPVINGNVNVALRKLKKVLEKMDFQKELSKREYYEKPSVKRKRQKDQAKKRWNKKVDGMIASGEWMPTPVVGQKHLKGKREKRKEWMKKEKVNRLRGNKYK